MAVSNYIIGGLSVAAIITLAVAMNADAAPKRNPEEPVFQRLWDLDKVMQAQRYVKGGWRQEKNSPHVRKPGDEAYIKRYGDVWYRMSWSDTVYSQVIFLSPTKYNITASTTGPEWDAAYEKLTAHVDIKGLTLSNIETKIMELVGNYKALKAPRKSLVPQIVYYVAGNRLTGEEALLRWRQRVEEVLLDIINGSIHTVFTTNDLTDNVISNYGVELHGVSRTGGRPLHSRGSRVASEARAHRERYERA